MVAIWALMRLALTAGCFWAGIAALNGEAVPRYVAGAVLMAVLTFAIDLPATVADR